MLFLGLFIIAVSFLILCLNTPKTMLFIVTLGLLFWFNPAIAGEEEKADILGFGAVSCAEYAKDYKRNQQIENWYYVWHTGFMTGMNTALSIVERDDLKRNLATKSMESMKRELRQYCNSNPLSDFAHAALVVMTGMTAYQDKNAPFTKLK